MTQPSIGDLLYLASYVIRLRVSAIQTAPDTPNQYTADLHVMGDQGAMNTDPIAGPPGPDGLQDFAFRRQDDATVNTPADLPTGLTDTAQDIGRYWLIDTLDDEGVVTAETAWTWYGSGWREFQMGVTGPPGAVPAIQVEQTLIDPTADSYALTSGGSVEPTWELYLAQPAGPAGPTQPLGTFGDVDYTSAPVAGDLLMFNGADWVPFALGQLLPGPYSMPESAFTAFSGFTQRALIGSYTVAAQPFDWTPVVWGHVGMGGVNLTAKPFRIGCQVLLGDAVSGTMIARGFGTDLGYVTIMPHYSTKADKNQTITPTNQYAMVPAGQTADLYVNLWNDGQWGVYDFSPGGAQIFVMAAAVNIAAQLPGAGA